MKVTQEKLPASQLGLEIEVPADLSQQTYDRTVQRLTQTANIPGFRKGKAPQKILLQRLGKTRVKAAAIEEIVQSSLEKAIAQENIEALGNYQLKTEFEELIDRFQPGEPFTFEATVDIPPEPQLEGYDNLEIKAEKIEYDPDRVNKVLDEHRSEHATLIPVENRPAQMGDVAIIDYEGKLVPEEEGQEPEPFTGGSATDFEIELVEGRLIEGMVEGMVGMNVGETKDLHVTFPEEYGREDLAGAPAIFTVTMKDLKEKELPELDDDFAQEISDFDTLEELRSTLEERFKNEAETKTKNNVDGAIVAQLIEKIDVELPETEIRQQVNVVLTRTAVQLEQYGMDISQFYNEQTMPRLQENARPEAIGGLKRKLALEFIYNKEGLEIEQSEVEAKIAEISEQLSDRDVDPDRLREYVEDEHREQAALDWLRERAKIEYVPEGSLSPDADSEDAEGTQEEAASTEEESV